MAEREPREPERQPAAEPRIETETPAPVVGRTAHYRLPSAFNNRPDGTFMFQWSIQHDPATQPRPQDRQSVYNYSRPTLDWDWQAEGEHKVVCVPRFTRRVSRRAPAEPPPDSRPLELRVQVQSLEAISRSRFGSHATPAAYEAARLQPYIEAEQARGRVERPEAVQRRDDRLTEMRGLENLLDATRRVLVRGQVTGEDGGNTMPLALMIGFSRESPGQLQLVDFTPGVRRSNLATAASSDECLALLQSRNSYPAGLAQVEVPANEVGIAPARRMFRTTGRSETGEYSDAAGNLSMALTVVGLVFPPLFILGAVAGAVSYGISMAERVHDARPSGRDTALDVLGFASSLLGGGAAAFAGRVFNVAGRSWRAVNLLGGAALALDGGSLALVSVSAMEEIEAIRANPALSDEDKRRQIARIVVSIAANTGMIIVSGAQQARAVREPHLQGTQSPDPHAPSPPAPAHGAPMSDARVVAPREAVGLSRRTGGAITPERIAREGVSARELLDAFPEGLTVYRGMRVTRDAASGKVRVYETRPTELNGERQQAGILNFSSERRIAEGFAERPGGNTFVGDTQILIVSRPISRAEALRYFDEGNFDPRIFENGLSTLDKWNMRPDVHLPDVTGQILVRDTNGAWRPARAGEIEWTAAPTPTAPAAGTPRAPEPTGARRTPDEERVAAEAARAEQQAAAQQRARLAHQREEIPELWQEARQLSRSLRSAGHADLAEELLALAEPLRFGGREARLISPADIATARQQLADSGALQRLGTLGGNIAPGLAERARGLAERIRGSLGD